MLDLDGTDIDVGPEEITVGEPVVVLPEHRRGSIEQPGNAIVRDVVGGLMKIAEAESRTRSQPERERRGDTEPPILGNIAAGQISRVSHEVEPEGSAGAKRWQGPIDIKGHTPGKVRTEIRGTRDGTIKSRTLARLIHHSAGCPAAECDR